jgi:hypothetical protein
MILCLGRRSLYPKALCLRSIKAFVGFPIVNPTYKIGDRTDGNISFGSVDDFLAALDDE